MRGETSAANGYFEVVRQDLEVDIWGEGLEGGHCGDVVMGGWRRRGGFRGVTWAAVNI